METNDPDRWNRPDHMQTGSGSLILPNSLPVLILGIMSIGMCWMFGLLSFIFGIVALVMASGAQKEYRRQPDLYTAASYRNLTTGKTCAVIGLCLGLFSLLFFTVIMLFFGRALFSMFAFI